MADCKGQRSYFCRNSDDCRLTAETDFEGFCDNPHPHPKKGIHLGRTSSKKTLKIVVRMLSTIDGYRSRVGPAT